MLVIVLLRFEDLNQGEISGKDSEGDRSRDEQRLLQRHHLVR